MKELAVSLNAKLLPVNLRVSPTSGERLPISKEQSGEAASAATLVNGSEPAVVSKEKPSGIPDTPSNPLRIEPPEVPVVALTSGLGATPTLREFERRVLEVAAKKAGLPTGAGFGGSALGAGGRRAAALLLLKKLIPASIVYEHVGSGSSHSPEPGEQIYRLMNPPDLPKPRDNWRRWFYEDPDVLAAKRGYESQRRDWVNRFRGTPVEEYLKIMEHQLLHDETLTREQIKTLVPQIYAEAEALLRAYQSPGEVLTPSERALATRGGKKKKRKKTSNPNRNPEPKVPPPQAPQKNPEIEKAREALEEMEGMGGDVADIIAQAREAGLTDEELIDLIRRNGGKRGFGSFLRSLLDRGLGGSGKKPPEDPPSVATDGGDDPKPRRIVVERSGRIEAPAIQRPKRPEKPSTRISEESGPTLSNELRDILHRINVSIEDARALMESSMSGRVQETADAIKRRSARGARFRGAHKLVERIDDFTNDLSFIEKHGLDQRRLTSESLKDLAYLIKSVMRIPSAEDIASVRTPEEWELHWKQVMKTLDHKVTNVYRLMAESVGVNVEGVSKKNAFVVASRERIEAQKRVNAALKGDSSGIITSRSELDRRQTPNYATAVLSLEGTESPIELPVVTSGYFGRQGDGSLALEARRFMRQGNARSNDTEVQLLELAAQHLKGNPNAQGQITIYTPYIPCFSCLRVMAKFREKYPQIEVKVYHEPFSTP